MQMTNAALEAQFHPIRITDSVFSDWPFGIMLLDGLGRILMHSQVAGELLERSERLDIASGRLLARRNTDTDAINRALVDITLGRSARSDWIVLGPRLRLRFKTTDQPTPDCPTEQRIIADLVDPGRPFESFELIADLVGGLTPAQRHLLIRLLMGYDLQEAADELNISVNTAKSHLMQIYRKRGVRRMTDLLLTCLVPFLVVPRT